MEKALDKDSFTLGSVHSPVNSLEMLLDKSFQPFLLHFHPYREGETCGSFAKPLELIKKHKKYSLYFLFKSTSCS